MRCDGLKRYAAGAAAFLLLAAASPVLADDPAADERAAAELRAAIPSLPHLVRATPGIYLVRIENIETLPDAADAGSATPPLSMVTARVERTLKGRRTHQLKLSLHMRRPVAEISGGELDALQRSPMFLTAEKFLSPRNPLFTGPWFEKDGTYLLFTDAAGEKLQGGPYGWLPVTSDRAFWVRTVQHLVQNPNSRHAAEMNFADFVARHRSAFVMLIGDCLGTEVVLSEPLWGAPAAREDIDPAHIHPESAAECAGQMDRKRAFLGLIEAEPWLYQVRRGYPNQSFVEIRDDMLDFTELGFDIGFPDQGRISVSDLAERMSRRSAR